MASLLDKLSKSEVDLDKIAKILQEMIREGNIELKTDLERDEISDIIELLFIDHVYKTEIGIDMHYEDLIVKKLMVLLVSKKRMGRTEIIDAIKAIFGSMKKEENTLSKKLGLG